MDTGTQSAALGKMAPSLLGTDSQVSSNPTHPSIWHNLSLSLQPEGRWGMHAHAVSGTCVPCSPAPVTVTWGPGPGYSTNRACSQRLAPPGGGSWNFSKSLGSQITVGKYW